jgi:hypothetical protein
MGGGASTRRGGYVVQRALKRIGGSLTPAALPAAA